MVSENVLVALVTGLALILAAWIRQNSKMRHVLFAVGVLCLALAVALFFRPPPERQLTASFVGVPSAHDGSTVFTFRVRFSEDPNVSFLVLRDRAFSVSGGTVRRALRVDGVDNLREIHVQPGTTGEIRIALPATTDCNAADAICTSDGRPLSHELMATVAGP